MRVEVELTPDALDRLASDVAERLGERRSTQWIRGAKAAGDYLGCGPSRIYDLVARRAVEHRHDGTVLMFRPEWLDEAMGR